MHIYLVLKSGCVDSVISFLSENTTLRLFSAYGKLSRFFVVVTLLLAFLSLS